jgi:PIN domain nuclease of toxin-antitoxin system
VVVLDTHTWIWAASKPDELSETVGQHMAEANLIGVSAISVWEVALLASKGRVKLDRPVDSWIQLALIFDHRVLEVPLTAPIALRSIELRADGLLGDPSDQILLATAKQNDAFLLTKDRRLREYAPDIAVW